MNTTKRLAAAMGPETPAGIFHTPWGDRAPRRRDAFITDMPWFFIACVLWSFELAVIGASAGWLWSS